MLKIRLPRKKARTKAVLQDSVNVPLNQIDTEDEQLNVLDFEDDSETEERENVRAKNFDKIYEEEKVWSRRGWSIDPRQEGGRISAFRPRLTNIDTNLDVAEIDLFLHFLPLRYERISKKQ